MYFPNPIHDTFVYALCCPDTEEIRYIGITTKGIQRFRSHLRDNRINSRSGKKSAVKNWVQKLKSENKIFKVIYLEYVYDSTLLYEKESEWILKYKYSGKLLNLTLGGEKGNIFNIKNPKPLKIIDDNGNTFDTVSSAAKYYNVHCETIRRRLIPEFNCNTKFKVKFKYAKST
jgi:hypothetical protein